MVERAKLMSHRMAYAQECVGKSHTRHSCGIRHFFTSNDVCLPVLVSTRQIFEYCFKRFKRKTVGIIGCHNRRIRFEVVAYRVYSGCSRKTFGCAHVEIGIHDSHFGKQFVVGKRILHSRLFIGYHGKRSYFAARSR